MSERTNAQWLADLSSEDTIAQAAAIDDLRIRLQRGIFYYLRRERSDLTERSNQHLQQMAEDFAQEAVLRILDNLDSFRGDSKFTTWATKIAVRVAISELRRARYRDFSLEDVTADGEIIPNLSTTTATDLPLNPEKATERSDVLAKINTAFEEVLTERQRVALEAVGLRGVPMDIVAEQLGTNRNALYKLLHDARKKLKAALEQQHLTLDYIMTLFTE